jgi:hypothetical protein
VVGRIVGDLGLTRAVRIHDEELLEPADCDFEHEFLAARRRERLAHIDVSKLIGKCDSSALRPADAADTARTSDIQSKSRRPTRILI